MSGRAEGAVRDVAGEASGVDRCPAPEASPVLQSAQRKEERINLIEIKP